MTPHILQQIVEAKQRAVSPLPESLTANVGDRRDFVAALIRPDGFDTLTTGRRSIIGEIKPKSPSEGVIFPRSNVPSIVHTYNAHADAISVLCDTERRFLPGRHGCHECSMGRKDTRNDRTSSELQQTPTHRRFRDPYFDASCCRRASGSGWRDRGEQDRERDAG